MNGEEFQKIIKKREEAIVSNKIIKKIILLAILSNILTVLITLEFAGEKKIIKEKKKISVNNSLISLTTKSHIPHHLIPCPVTLINKVTGESVSAYLHKIDKEDTHSQKIIAVIEIQKKQIKRLITNGELFEIFPALKFSNNSKGEIHEIIF